MAEDLAFGIVLRDRDDALFPPVERICAFLTNDGGHRVHPRAATSYEELAQLMREGLIHAAWIPPVPFLELEGKSLVVPLLTIVREGQSDFASVLLVRNDSGIDALEALRGKRAAWVDRWSSSGFVVPRINLAARGLDPQALFAEDVFYGSHEGAIRALLRGDADVVGTFGRSPPGGEVTTGGWTQIEGGKESLRVLAAFGRIPGDLFAAASSLDPEVRESLAAGLMKAQSDDKTRADMKRVFDADALVRGDLASYEELRQALRSAREKGLLG